jgi:hypothetical protein
MPVSTNNKNKVFSSNKTVNYVYFLVEISHPDAGHVGCYLLDQAYTGTYRDSTEKRLWNQVNAQCHANSEKSGLVYTIRACGSREWCLETARDNGYSYC